MRRADRRRAFVPLLAACLAVALAGPADSQKRKDLEDVERKLEAERTQKKAVEQRGRALRGAVSKLRRELIAAARTAQDREVLLTTLEKKLPVLRLEAIVRKERLVARRNQMQGTLGALERLSRNPPQALLLTPGRPIDVVRSTMLLRAALPQLRSRAASLKDEIRELGRVQREISLQREQVELANEALAEQQKRLELLLGRKLALQKQVRVESRRISRRVEKLAKQARDLRELFARLDTERSRRRPARTAPEALPDPTRPVGIRPFPERGPVTLPARGRLVERYGQSTGSGNTAKGVTYETRAGARVVAPFDGRVAFAGPFRGYGHILIIEHGAAYHTLLAGLTRVDSTVGQWVLAGEPVGVMGHRKGGGPRLYVELRRKGQPINPLPWFAAGNDKVRG